MEIAGPLLARGAVAHGLFTVRGESQILAWRLPPHRVQHMLRLGFLYGFNSIHTSQPVHAKQCEQWEAIFLDV